jgi:hypothetical protein
MTNDGLHLKIKTLDISGNAVKGLPIELYTMVNLKTLHATRCNIQRCDLFVYLHLRSKIGYCQDILIFGNTSSKYNDAIYIYIFMYMFIQITFINMHVCICLHIYAYSHVLVNMLVYSYIYIYIYIYVYTCMYIHIYIYICTFISIYI